MRAPVTYRSRLAQGITVLVGVVGLAALASFVAESGPTALLPTAMPVTFVVVLGWAALWRPCARVDDDGVTLVNLVRTVHVPWSRFRGADTRWALTITTDDERTFSAWAVPAGSGFGARIVPRVRTSGDVSPGVQRKLDSTGTAEAAAVEIAARVDAGAVKGAKRRDVAVTLNREVVAALGVLAVLTALSVALG